jgi:hypothetical protein
MKRILYLLLPALLVSCTYNSPPQEVAPYYMYKFSDSQEWSAADNFIKLDLDAHHFEKVEDAPYNLMVANSNLGMSGSSYENIDGTYAGFKILVDGDMYPNAPFKKGEEWAFNDSVTLPISEVFLSVMYVKLMLPIPFKNHLKKGFYRLSHSRMQVGFSLYNRWGIRGEDSLGNSYSRYYSIYMQPTGKRKIEIIGIDTSNSEEIRITAEFEGVFAADRFLVKEMGREYEIEEKGSFSFVIKL